MNIIIPNPQELITKGEMYKRMLFRVKKIMDGYIWEYDNYDTNNKLVDKLTVVAKEGKYAS